MANISTIRKKIIPQCSKLNLDLGDLPRCPYNYDLPKSKIEKI